jgi:hypothetical protein
MQSESKNAGAFVHVDRLLSRGASPARECGPCTACCTVMAVHELAKPARRACDHVSHSGCTVHRDRPESCRAFHCLWLRGAMAGDNTRPDELGVCFDAFNATDTGKVMLYAFELWEGALETPEAQRIIEALCVTSEVHLSYRDHTWRTIASEP